MIARSNAQLGKEIALVRKALRLSFQALAAELRITPEWLSKIVNGHQQPSYNIGLRFQEFLRRRGIACVSDSRGVEQVEYTQGEPATLRAAIMDQCNELAANCGDDPDRLRALLNRLGALRANRMEREVLPKAASPRSAKVARKALLKERLKLLGRPDGIRVKYRNQI